MQRPSEQVLLQRVRNHLIDYLEVAASYRAQLRYQEQAPQVQVELEIIEQWADWVGPQWQQQFISPVFTEAEREAIAEYQRIWDALRQCMPEPLPPLLEMHKNPLWEELRQAASVAYGCFVRVGKMSESEEYVRSNVASIAPTQAALAVLIYASDLASLLDFYRQVLQLSVDDSDQTQSSLVVLQGRGIELLIHAIPAEINDGLASSSALEVREDCAIKPIFQVHDLEHARDLVVQLGGSLASDIHAGPSYCYCQVVDPEGNVVQLRAERRQEQA